MQKTCKECIYYKPDYGVHCFNGWSDPEGLTGKCMVEPKPVFREAHQVCRHFKEKAVQQNDSPDQNHSGS